MEPRQHWNKREQRALAELGIPPNATGHENHEETHGDLCGWCYQKLDDCVKAKPGTCGYAIDNGAHGIQ